MTDTTKNALSDWDKQVIRKTAQRHKAAYRRSRKKARATALMVELGLFLLILALMTLEHTGLVDSILAIPMIVIAICVMSFCGGFATGYKHS